MADEDMVEVPEKLSKWFTHDEWKQMSYYERKRTLNVLENYHTLTGLGINVPKPDFMYPALHKTPRPLTQITPVYSTNKVTERPKEKDQYSFRDAGEVSSVHHSRRKPPSYELRKRKYNCYREDSSSDDDDYLFCDECNREWFGDCPSHGPLIHIMDTQVSVYPLDPERAAKTLPSIFRIGPSAIRKAGLGVWTTTSLLPRTVFGPYEGSLSDTANDNGYCWLVRENGRPSGFIDASDSSISNWMRFVNCSRHEKEQNLVAFQYKRKIYYRTTRLIPPDVELLVWYGEEFAKVLGINKKKYHKNKQCAGDVYCCIKCRLSFSNAAYRDRHLSYCRGRSMPSKVSCTTAIEHEDGECKNSNSDNYTDVMHDTAKSSASKVEDNTNSISSTQPNSSSRPQCPKMKCKRKNLAQICIKRVNVRDTNEDRIQSEENYLDIASLSTDNGIMDKMEYSDSSMGCNKKFSSTSNVNSQERTHTGELPYKFPTCNKTLDKAHSLHVHAPIHTGERPYICTTCNKAFSRTSDLHRHERIHTGERPYKCTTCYKAFSQTSDLHRHERIHTGERPYKCTTCNKAFSRTSLLHLHERIHTGERPYKCTTCNKAFSRTSLLHLHERIHTGERPYKCTTCNKAFSDASNLHVHERIHTGERPYKCTTCNKAFSQISPLHRHERIHTGERR